MFMHADGRVETAAEQASKLKKKKKKKTQQERTVKAENEDPPSKNESTETVQKGVEIEGESGAPEAPQDTVPTEAEDAALRSRLPAWAPLNLHYKLLKNIQRLDFKTPTPIQEQCLRPAISQRKDIIGAAATGSGKTLAFGLPILHHILEMR